MSFGTEAAAALETAVVVVLVLVVAVAVEAVAMAAAVAGWCSSAGSSLACCLPVAPVQACVVGWGQEVGTGLGAEAAAVAVDGVLGLGLEVCGQWEPWLGAAGLQQH